MIADADRQILEGDINYTLIPKITSLGYPLGNMGFRFEKYRDTYALWTITSGLLKHYIIDPEHITNTFGVPVTVKQQEQEKPDEMLNAHDPFF